VGGSRRFDELEVLGGLGVNVCHWEGDEPTMAGAGEDGKGEREGELTRGGNGEIEGGGRWSGPLDVWIQKLRVGTDLPEDQHATSDHKLRWRRFSVDSLLS
jgi:hypothetical protein